MSKLRQIYMVRHARQDPESSHLDSKDEALIRESCRQMGGYLNSKIAVIFHANHVLARLTAELIHEELMNPVGGHGRPIEVSLAKAKALTSKQEGATNKVMHDFIVDLKARSKYVNAYFIIANYDALKRAKACLVSELPTHKHLLTKNAPEVSHAQGYVLDSVMNSIWDWRIYSHLIRSGR